MLLQKHQELNAAQFVCQKPLTLMNADPLYNGIMVNSGPVLDLRLGFKHQEIPEREKGVHTHTHTPQPTQTQEEIVGEVTADNSGLLFRCNVCRLIIMKEEYFILRLSVLSSINRQECPPLRCSLSRLARGFDYLQNHKTAQFFEKKKRNVWELL